MHARSNPPKKPVYRGLVIHLVDSNALEVTVLPLESGGDVHGPSGPYVELPEDWDVMDREERSAAMNAALTTLMKAAKKNGILLIVGADGYPVVEEG